MEFEILHISYAEEPEGYPDTEEWGKILAENARKGAALGVDCGKMCADCAFVPKDKQPDLRGYNEAVQGAVSMMISGGQFNCHTEDHENANKPCAGFQYAQLYFNR